MSRLHSHTPGPWWCDDHGFIAAGSGETYVTIADPNCTHDLAIEERVANTLLIAAAPDLLVALQYAYEILGKAYDSGLAIPGVDVGSALQPCADAIAQAQGGTS